MLSNLPILADDPIKFLFVADTGSSSDCEPFQYHRIIPIVLSGQYDEYGRADRIKHPLADFVQQRLLAAIDGKDEGSFETIFDQMRHEDFKFHVVMVRSDVYDHVISQAQIELVGGTQVTIKDLIQYGYRWIQDMKDGLTQGEIFFELRSFGGTNIFNILMNNLKFHWSVIHVAEEIPRAVKEGNLELAKQLVEATAETIMLCIVMDRARRSFHIPSGAGSQDSSTEFQRLIAEATITTARKIDKFCNFDETT